jgi:hypothetical protein
MAYTREQIEARYSERITRTSALRGGSDFSSWSSAQKDAFFAAALALENEGRLGMLQVEHLREFTSHGGKSAQIGDRDARAIVGVRTALSVFIDRHNRVPWDLSDLPSSGVRALLRPGELVEHTYPEGEDHVHGGTDHNPFQIHLWALENFCKGDHEASTHALLEWIRANMHHLSEGETDYLDYDPPKITEITRAKIGTCHYTGALIAATLGTLNVPVLRRHYRSRAHEFTLYPTLGRAMGHNDWPYNRNFADGPVGPMLMDVSAFQARVLALDTPGNWEAVSDALQEYSEGG